MTERIYYTDSYIQDFTARVVSCEKSKRGRWEVVLTRTAFYPEGGGQPGDRGTLNGVRVLDTQEKGGEVVHLTDGPLKPGTEVQGELDWVHRFDQMQNHSGEHIVSGLLYRYWGCNNVGFHMGSESITIDFDQAIPLEALSEIELIANAVVWEDVETEITVYTHEEAQKQEFRSKKELPGDVRVVNFLGADSCACCGTHVRRTGEIGLIKLLSAQRSRGGMRLEMLCGRRALAYVNVVLEQNHRISVALSAKALNTAAAVERLKGEQEQAQYRLVGLENREFARRAEELSGAGNVLLIEPPMSPESVRKLAAAVVETCGGRCAVFAGDDASGYKYAIGERNGNLRELVKELNRALHGRGGGKPDFVQGSVQGKKAEIEAFFAALEG